MRSLIENSIVIFILVSGLIINFDRRKMINLKIQSINLNLYADLDSSLDEGIKIHYTDPYVILGHSGIGSNAVFNKLFYLKVNDEIDLIIDRKKFTYKINKISSFSKGEKIKIKKDSRYLYLITCDLINMQKQWIFSSKLTKIAEI